MSEHSRLSDWGWSLFGIVFVFPFWHISMEYELVSTVVTATPWNTLTALNEWQDLIWSAFVSTTFVAIWGFGSALFLAIVVSTIFILNSTIRETVMPLVVSVNSIPRVALAPLIIFYVGGENSAKYVIAAWVAFFPMFLNIVEGLDATDQEELDLLQVAGATKWQKFKKIRIPNALPSVFDGLKIGVSLAMVGAIVGEYVQGNTGVGALVIATMGQLQMDIVYAVIGVTALATMVVVLFVFVLQDRLIFWSDTNLFS
jgi:NitT/TauT family transport system permease protein